MNENKSAASKRFMFLISDGESVLTGKLDPAIHSRSVEGAALFEASIRSATLGSQAAA